MILMILIPILMILMMERVRSLVVRILSNFLPYAGDADLSLALLVVRFFFSGH